MSYTLSSSVIVNKARASAAAAISRTVAARGALDARLPAIRAAFFSQWGAVSGFANLKSKFDAAVALQMRYSVPSVVIYPNKLPARPLLTVAPVIAMRYGYLNTIIEQGRDVFSVAEMTGMQRAYLLTPEYAVISSQGSFFGGFVSSVAAVAKAAVNNPLVNPVGALVQKTTGITPMQQLAAGAAIGGGVAAYQALTVGAAGSSGAAVVDTTAAATTSTGAATAATTSTTLTSAQAVSLVGNQAAIDAYAASGYISTVEQVGLTAATTAAQAATAAVQAKAAQAAQAALAPKPAPKPAPVAPIAQTAATQPANNNALLALAAAAVAAKFLIFV